MFKIFICSDEIEVVSVFGAKTKFKKKNFTKNSQKSQSIQKKPHKCTTKTPKTKKTTEACYTSVPLH